MSDESSASIDLSSAQTGDVSLGGVAGRDIYKGAPAEDLVKLIAHQIDKEAQFRMLDLNAREIRQGQLDRQLADIAAELRAQRWILIGGLFVIILALAFI